MSVPITITGTVVDFPSSAQSPNKIKCCKICSVSGELAEFIKNQKLCKSCYNKKRKQEYAQNKDKILIRCKKYRENNREKIREADRTRYKNNPNHYLENRESLITAQKRYRAKNKEKIALKAKADRKRISQKNKNRRKIDPIFNLKYLMRARLRKFLKHKKWKKDNTTQNYIGCNKNELKQYLESKFKPGMTWENKGEWHIDHIIPLSSAKTPEDIYTLTHYTNLQPLWVIEHNQKTKIENSKRIKKCQ